MRRCTVAKLPLTQMKINFSVRCDYARFKRLLKAFETNRRWLAVRGIAITRDSDQPGSVTVQLELDHLLRGAGGRARARRRAGRGRRLAEGELMKALKALGTRKQAILLAVLAVLLVLAVVRWRPAGTPSKPAGRRPPPPHTN